MKKTYRIFISIAVFLPLLHPDLILCESSRPEAKIQVSSNKISTDFGKNQTGYDLSLEKATVNAGNFIILTLKNKGSSPIPEDLLRKVRVTIRIDDRVHSMLLTDMASQKIISINDSILKLRTPGFELTLNTGLKITGKSYVVITIDSGRILQEADEQNNKLEIWLEPVKAIQESRVRSGFKAGLPSKEALKTSNLPDLSIEKAEIVYADDLKHQALLIIQIRNVGNGDSNLSDYLVEIKNEFHDWKPLAFASGECKLLRPAETVEYRRPFFRLDYLDSSDLFSSGENLIRITLDPQNKLKELDKNNNISVLKFRPLMPDLKITDLKLETRDLSDGTSEAKVHLKIRNEGGAFPVERRSKSSREKQDFLNLTLKRPDGKSLTVRFAGPNFSEASLKNYFIAPGSSSEFTLTLPEVSIYEPGTSTGYKDVQARISNNFLCGNINVTFTLDGGQVLYDADYTNNSFTCNLSGPQTIKLHPQSPSAYLNREDSMRFFLISNLDIKDVHRGEILGSGFGPGFQFFWGNQTLKIKNINLLRTIEDKYRVSQEPVWEIIAEMPALEGREELRVGWGSLSFPLGSIRIFGPPVITEMPSELVEPGKKVRIKGRNFISPEHFGKMFQNLQVEIRGGGYLLPYYFISENEFQTEETNFDCSFAPGMFDLVITKSISGKPETRVQVAGTTFGLSLKPIITAVEPDVCTPGQTIKVVVENYCEQGPLRIGEFILNGLPLEEISRSSPNSQALFILKVPEEASSGKISFRYGQTTIESSKELVIKKSVNTRLIISASKT